MSQTIDSKSSTSTLPPLLRIEDAAAYRGVSRTRIYSMLRAGELTRVKDGGRTLVSRGELDRQAADLIATAAAETSA